MISLFHDQVLIILVHKVMWYHTGLKDADNSSVETQTGPILGIEVGQYWYIIVSLLDLYIAFAICWEGISLALALALFLWVGRAWSCVLG